MEFKKRLDYNSRLKLEALYNAGVSVLKISKTLNYSRPTIYKEIKRGLYQHLNTDYKEISKYSADKAQAIADYEQSAKGASLKIGNDYRFVEFVEDMILNKKYSPSAIIGYIQKNKMEFDTKICVSTLYNYISNGIFLHITNKNLLRKGKRKRKTRKVRRAKRINLGRSIEERKPEIYERKEFGHWEMDSVIGKRGYKNTLVCLTERKTRFELIFKSKDKTALSTVKILDFIENKIGSKNFRKVFRSITCDNGTEFSFTDMLEKSCKSNRQRTDVYYCHPYCSSERGSNENQNGFIRRFIPKGTDINKVSLSRIREINRYINEYPRLLFGYASSADRFEQELQNLGIEKFIYFF